MQDLRVDQLTALPTPTDLPPPRHRSAKPTKAAAAGEAGQTRPFRLVGLTWAGATPSDLTTWVRTKASGGSWSQWFELDVQDEHAPDPGSAEAAGVRPGTEPIFVPSSTAMQVAVASADGSSPQDLQVHLIDPGRSASDSAVGVVAPGTANAQVSQPRIYSRAEWGADESLRTCCTEYGEVLGAVVHHTVSANDYSSADVPALIRAIYAFHVTSRGYRDIGYNFLVDRFGRVWEGRFGGIDKPVIGAQALGFNDDTSGTSVIGTYTETEPSQASLDTLTALLAWKLDLHDVDPLSVVDMDGTMVPAISGHRDTYATECPGGRLYAKLGTLRTASASAIAAAQPVPPADPRYVKASYSPSIYALQPAGGAYPLTYAQWQAAGFPTPTIGEIPGTTYAKTSWSPNVYARQPGTSFSIWLTSAQWQAAGSPAPEIVTSVPNVNEVYARGAGSFTVRGKGFGHGFGLSQWGAYQAAVQGNTWPTIVGFYYPGTSLTTAPTGSVRVLLEGDTGADLIVRPEAGLRVLWTDTAGQQRDVEAPASVGGCSPVWWRTVTSGGAVSVQYLCNDVWTTWQASDPSRSVTFRPSDGTIDTAVRTDTGFIRKGYRGDLVGRPSGASIVVTNVVPVESYLYSVVANEAVPSWPQEALRAQAVAARSYALRERNDRSGSSFDVYDSTKSQVYPGRVLYDDVWNVVRSYEDSRTSTAVDATGSTYLMAGGIPSFTQFSSSNGGWTARGSQPYLPIQADGWDAAAAPNPYLDWTTTVGAAALESRYPSIGTLQAVRVTERDGGGLWGGRVLTVVLEGSAGSVTVSGDGAIRSALGTRSSYLTFG